MDRFRTFFLVLLACAMASSPLLAADTDAVCTVTFDAAWSEKTHPIQFPASAHFSPLIGGTHDALTVFWEPGALASPGIESMAETGSTFPLDTEIEQAIGLGDAGEVISGGGVDLSPGSVATDFQATLDHSYVTLVTMIAPSPDWFVGVHGWPLFSNGRWIEVEVVDLLAYDSGTDSGTTFTSSNQDTSPPQPISRIVASPFPDEVPLGTFTFQCASNLMFLDGFESGDLSSWSSAVGVGP